SRPTDAFSSLTTRAYASAGIHRIGTGDYTGASQERHVNVASTPLVDLSISECVRRGMIDSEIDANVVDNALSSADPLRFERLLSELAASFIVLPAGRIDDAI